MAKLARVCVLSLAFLGLLLLLRQASARGGLLPAETALSPADTTIFTGTIASPGRWLSASPLTTQSLCSLHLLSAADGWAVGYDGTILRWNGTVWKPVVSNTTDWLCSVHMLSAIDGWAVGFGGAIHHWDGTAWEKVLAVDPQIGAFLYSVYMLSPSDGWAVGDLGTIAHWNGTTWDRVASPSTSVLLSVHILSATDGWAVGGRDILHWDGAVWTIVPSGSST